MIARPALSAATRSFSYVLFIALRRLVAFCNQGSDQLSFDSRLAQRERYSLITLQPAGDLAGDPVIKTEFHVDQMNSIISHDRDIDPFAVEDQCLEVVIRSG
jgi:hypothetical protein